MELEAEVPNQIRVEWIVLADYAEVVAGKLYLMGGGWDAILSETLPARRIVAVAVSCTVPWNQTNEPHQLEFELQDADGNPKEPKALVEFEVGRPAGISRGQAQRFQVAGMIPMEFDSAGTYRVMVRINGEDAKSTPFRVNTR